MRRALKSLYNQIFRRKRLQELRDSMTYVHAEQVNGMTQYEIRVKSPYASALTDLVVKAFDEGGGINYLSWSCLDSVTMTPYELTIQKQSGKKASDLNFTMRRALERIMREAAVWSDGSGRDIYLTATDALRWCGYLVEGNAEGVDGDHARL